MSDCCTHGASAFDAARRPISADISAAAPALACRPTGHRAVSSSARRSRTRVAIVDADGGRVEATRQDGRRGALRRGRSAATGDAAWVSNWGGRWPQGRRPHAADRTGPDRRPRRRRRARHRLDGHDRRGSTSDRATVTAHGRRSACIRRRWPGTSRAQRLYVANANSRLDLGDRHAAAHGAAATIAIEPFDLDAAGRRADGARARARRRDALRRARRHQRGRGRRRAGADGARLHPDRLVSEPPRARAATARSSPSPRCSASGRARGRSRTERGVHAYRGTVQRRRPCPTPRNSTSYTTAVAENNHIATARQQLAATDVARDRALPVPRRAGDPVAHRARRLHHQGEPHLRPGVRRPAARQRRSVARDVRRGRDAEPPQAGHRVRAARQLLRHRRQLRRRPPVGDAGQRDALRACGPATSGAAIRSTAPTRSPTRSTGFLWDLALARGKTRQGVRRVRRPPARDATAQQREPAARALEGRRRLHARLVDHGAARAAQRRARAQLPALHASRFPTSSARRSS